jgi:hypothetical protein
MAGQQEAKTCALCDEDFAPGDKIKKVWDKDVCYPVHRPCLGEAVAMHVSGVQAIDEVAEEQGPLSEEKQKEVLYNRISRLIGMMGKIVIELTELEVPFLAKFAGVVEALQKQEPAGPYAHTTKGHHLEDQRRVECGSCRAWVCPTWTSENRSEEEILRAHDWHKDGCPWVLREKALGQL